MSKKITISLPDELHSRLDMVRNDFNVSAICQKALEVEINIYEQIKKGGKGMENHIVKLQAQKEEYDKRYYNYGQETGVDCAKDMDYEDFKEIENCGNDFNTTNYYEIYWKDIIENAKKEYDDDNIDEDNFLNGFLEGVREYWEEIKDKL